MISIGRNPGPCRTGLDVIKAIKDLVKDELRELNGGKLNAKELARADQLAKALSSSETLKELNVKIKDR